MTGGPFIVCVAVQASLAKKVSHDIPKCLIFVHTMNPLLIMKLHHWGGGGGGGGGVLSFFLHTLSNLGSGPASTFNPKKISGISSTQEKYLIF